ncbi:MAG: glutaredoxin family protein [Syntrophobacteraceae bacterium]|jgi:glutaredoxin-like protein NrdH
MNDCVKLYALSTCGHCKHAKQLLDSCGVPYECVTVDKLIGEARRLAFEEMKKENPQCAFPMLVIGNRVIIGFQAEEIREAVGLR